MRTASHALRRRAAAWVALLALACFAAARSGHMESGAAHAAERAVLVVCAPGSSGDDCGYTSIAAALAAAPAGATVRIRPGIYREAAVLRAHRVSVLAEPGARMVGVAAQGKAALVIKGDDATIEGLECSGIWVPDGNGACVRAEGANLTLRRVYFHDSQEGILGGRGRVVIEDSVFERLGGDAELGLGQAHAIYIGHRADELVVRRSRVLASKEEGHEIKSRAKRTFIEDSVVASLDGRDSRLIDVPNGGVVVVRGNVLEKGPSSSNPDMIGIGLERGRNSDIDHAVNSTLIEGNTILYDRADRVRLFRARGVPSPTVTGNTVVGGPPYRGGGNKWFADRRAAGLPPYPALVPRTGE
jgi:hypothetical protein